MSGKVFASIRAKHGKDCAKFWWITWPLGHVTEFGRHCGGASLEIPGLFSAAVAAKLRVRAEDQPLKIVVTSSEEVANHVTIPFSLTIGKISGWTRRRVRVTFHGDAGALFLNGQNAPVSALPVLIVAIPLVSVQKSLIPRTLSFGRIVRVSPVSLNVTLTKTSFTPAAVGSI